MKRLFFIPLLLALAISASALHAQMLQAIVGTRNGVSLPSPVLQINLAGCTTAPTGCSPSSSTTAYDQTGNGNNGTWNGSACGNAAGWYSVISGLAGISDAGCFDGSTVFVHGTAMPSIGSTFAVAAWVKSGVSTQSGYTRIAETFYTSAWYLGTDSTGTHFQWIVNDSSVGSCSGGTISSGTLQFVMGTYDGTNGRLYVGSSLVSGPCSFSSPSSYSGAWWIGGPNPLAGGGLWNGLISEFQVFSVAPTPTQEAAFYSTEAAVVFPTLFGPPTLLDSMVDPSRVLRWMKARLAGAA